MFVIFALAVYTSAFYFHIPPLPSPLPSLPSPLPPPFSPLLHPHVAMRPRFFNLRPVKMRTLGEEPPEEEDSTFAEVCHSVLLGYQGPDGQDYAVFHQSIVFLFGSVLQSSDSHFEGSPFQKVLVSCVHTVGVSFHPRMGQLQGCHSVLAALSKYSAIQQLCTVCGFLPEDDHFHCLIRSDFIKMATRTYGCY